LGECLTRYRLVNWALGDDLTRSEQQCVSETRWDFLYMVRDENLRWSVSVKS
jgi:hypothetical protein